MNQSIKHILLGVSLVAATLTTGTAQKLDRSKLPADAPAPQIKVGSPETFTLANGLKVFVVPNAELPRVAFNLVLDYEPIMEGSKAGYVDIAGQLLRSGTKNRTKEQLDEEVDYIGAVLSTSPTGVYAMSLKKHTPKLVELMADVLLNPSFPPAELDKLKKQTKSALAAQKDNPNSISSRVSNVLVYGKNHPYGELETEETVDRVTVDDCRTFYNTFFRPNIGYLAVVGDITPAEAKAQLEKAFGSWQRADVPKPTYPMPQPPAKTKIALVDRPSSVQSIISIVYPVELKPGTVQAIQANITNDILGGNEARLFNNLREKHGYTYGAYSSLQSDRLVGRFRANASVRNAVTDSAVAEFMNELKNIGANQVSLDEIRRTKNATTGGFVFSLEDPQTIANFAINTARYNLPADFYANYLKYVDAVTEADVQTTATKYVKPENAYIVVVGKASEIADKLKRFGEIEYYDINGNKVDAPTPAKAAPAGMSAQQVIDKYITAIGGKEALSKITDMTTTMSTEVQGQTMQMVSKAKAPNKSSMSVSAMGMEVMKMVNDGSKAARTMQGQTQALEGKDAQQLQLQGGLFPELRYTQNGIKSTLVGTEKVEGKDAYKVTHTSADGGLTWTDYFDANTGLKIQTVSTQRGPQGEVEVPTGFSDYKDVNGVKIPHTMTQRMGPMNLTLKVDKVEVNKGLQDADFAVK